MTLIIETGAGVRYANAYVNVDYVTAYLTARNRQTENSWTSVGIAVQEAAIVAATDYVDKRFSPRFRGLPKVTFDETYAEAELSFSGLPEVDEELLIGDETYKFVSGSPEAAFDILIGATASETAANLEAALNAGTGGGSLYGLGTPQSRHVSAVAAAGVVTLTASAPGASGALTALSGAVTNLAVGSFSGGRDGGIQDRCFPRTGAYDNNGHEIIGIPDRLKQAVSEYAIRATDSNLLPDPTTDAFGGQVTSRKEQVGPIGEEVRYGFGTVGRFIFSAYPAADKLLRPLLLGSGGGVIRG